MLSFGRTYESNRKLHLVQWVRSLVLGTFDRNQGHLRNDYNAIVQTHVSHYLMMFCDITVS